MSEESKGKKNKKLTSNYKIVFLFTIIFILLIFISTMKFLGEGQWKTTYDIISNTFELLYFLSGVVLIIGLYIGYKQLEITNTDIKIRNERAAVDKGLDYLNFFAETLLPKTAKYYETLGKTEKLELVDWYPELSDYKLDVFSLNDETQLKMLQGIVIRQEKGIQDIFNHLEFFSAGILHGLAKEEVVYDPLSGVFCTIVKREMIMLCSLRNQGSPYENLLELYKKWDKRKENEAILLQIEEAEHNIKLARQQVAADEESIKPQKPIGL